MKRKIYRARPILSIVDIIFIITLSLLVIGSILGYIFDQYERIGRIIV